MSEIQMYCIIHNIPDDINQISVPHPPHKFLLPTYEEPGLCHSQAPNRRRQRCWNITTSAKSCSACESLRKTSVFLAKFMLGFAMLGEPFLGVWKMFGHIWDCYPQWRLFHGTGGVQEQLGFGRGKSHQYQFINCQFIVHPHKVRKYKNVKAISAIYIYIYICTLRYCSDTSRFYSYFLAGLKIMTKEPGPDSKWSPEVFAKVSHGGQSFEFDISDHRTSRLPLSDSWCSIAKWLQGSKKFTSDIVIHCTSLWDTLAFCSGSLLYKVQLFVQS